MAVAAIAADWTGVSEVKLIEPGESRLLAASERVGNQAWGMHLAARRMTRRLEHRVGVLLQCVRPLGIVLLGFAVWFVVASIFAPLIKLIHEVAN